MTRRTFIYHSGSISVAGILSANLTPSHDISLLIAQSAPTHPDLPVECSATSSGAVIDHMLHSRACYILGKIVMIDRTEDHCVVQCHPISWHNRYGSNSYNG